MKAFNRLAAASALATCAFAVPAFAQTTASTDSVTFAATHASLTTNTFPAFEPKFGTSYTQAGTTFSAPSLVQLHDGGYNNAYYLDAAGTLSFLSTSSAIGFNLGSFYGTQQISYLVNGLSGTLNVSGEPGTTFIGFDSGNSSTALSGMFRFSDELDVVNSFQTGVSNAASTVAAAAPEPGTWAMMILGFGLAGFALRRRQKVTTEVSYAA